MKEKPAFLESGRYKLSADMFSTERLWQEDDHRPGFVSMWESPSPSSIWDIFPTVDSPKVRPGRSYQPRLTVDVGPGQADFKSGQISGVQSGYRLKPAQAATGKKPLDSREKVLALSTFTL